MNTVPEQSFPFVYGAQYYRAPTPSSDFWERDFEHMKNLGFNTVKFWVQWRWSERTPGVYYWDDLDRLMHLAETYKLSVILNLICDVMPVWAEKLFPDCRMIDRSGNPVPTEAVICRQIGGYPGPCLNHPEMRKYRRNFFHAALEHFKQFPNLLAWDVWNEPEHHLGRRDWKNEDHLLCYCPNCRRKFIRAMQKKYSSIDRLNERWGRCYTDFDEIELPRNASVIADFIDWREFQLNVMTEEAKMRLNLVREVSPDKFPHLHVVPHTIHCFNAVNCVDDFALADACDIFGATMMKDPIFAASAASSAGDKPFYNAEWHINFGSASMHQRVIDRKTFLREALPQLAWNVRGFLYWQFRPETLGLESPAWGVIHPDGSDRPVSIAAREFISRLAPHLPDLMRAYRKPPKIAILKSLRNELFFQRFSQEKGNWLYRSIRGWVNTLQSAGLPFKFISTEQLENSRLDGIRILILPAAYALSRAEAAAADHFLRSGGTLFAEGSVGGWCADSGRHSTTIPGCGLAESWEIRETESVSSYHLSCESDPAGEVSGASGDSEKALRSIRIQGAEYMPIHSRYGIGYGALNFSFIEGCDCIASFDGKTCVIRKNIGDGTLIYAGTYLGIAAAEKSGDFLRALLEDVATAQKVISEKQKDGIYLSPLCTAGEPLFFVAENRLDHSERVILPIASRDLFNDGCGTIFELEADSAALYRAEQL